MAYKQKNTAFNVDDNESIDRIATMIESNGVLSPSLTTRINNLCLWIVSNHMTHELSIKEAIDKLIDELRWLNIFNSHFIDQLRFNLYNGLNWEMMKAKK